MQGFFNYVNRQLCEYQTIFPNTVQLLDHILFTNGTGLHVNPRFGMIYSDIDEEAMFIDQYPDMNDAAWDELIKRCHAKERSFSKIYDDIGGDIAGAMKEILAQNLARYKPVSVDHSMFSEQYLYDTLRKMSQEKTQNAMANGRPESFVRPYPLSPGYANIFDLEENTPYWFLEIAINNCKAWVRFLTEEIEQNHVWIKPSLRPKSPNHDKQVNAFTELFDVIKLDPNYDGWLDKRKEPESDYADLTWTTKHRNLIADQAQRLSKILKD